MKPKRKRTRPPSLESEIRATARQIHATGMQEAMRAAAFMVCAKKLDEIRAILQITGVSNQSGLNQLHGVQPQGNGTDVRPEGSLAIEHPCSYCGREAVYRTRPHRFNRTGTWLCQLHYALRRQHEQAGTTDPRVRDASGAVPLEVPPEVPLAPEKKDTGADTTADSVMAALGVQ